MVVARTCSNACRAPSRSAFRSIFTMPIRKSAFAASSVLGYRAATSAKALTAGWVFCTSEIVPEVRTPIVVESGGLDSPSSAEA